MFGSIGPLELMLIFIIVLVVFGADRLPELARGLGKGMREFRRAADEVKREIMVDPDLNVNLDEPLPEPPSDSVDPYEKIEEEMNAGEEIDLIENPEESEPESPIQNEHDVKQSNPEKKDFSQEENTGKQAKQNLAG